MGARLLQQVAQRVAPLIRASDTLARFGGDEFVVLLNKMASQQAADIVAEKIVEVLKEPVDIDGHLLSATTSVGIAVYPEDGADAETLLRWADMAMYAAKKKGRNAFCRFMPQMLSDESLLTDRPN